MYEAKNDAMPSFKSSDRTGPETEIDPASPLSAMRQIVKRLHP